MLAVVIPSFRAAATIGPVLAAIGSEVARIYVVDDGCPDSTGRHVALKAMPPVRRLANRLLSILHRGATGYWRIGDPANGYTAVHAEALRRMTLDDLADCFFFETDMLFGLRKIGARVADVPLPARYSDEVSSVSLRRVAPRFGALITIRLVERLARGLGERLMARPLAGTPSS